jgi:hypothetical protein
MVFESTEDHPCRKFRFGNNPKRDGFPQRFARGSEPHQPQQKPWLSIPIAAYLTHLAVLIDFEVVTACHVHG